MTQPRGATRWSQACRNGKGYIGKGILQKTLAESLLQKCAFHIGSANSAAAWRQTKREGGCVRRLWECGGSYIYRRAGGKEGQEHWRWIQVVLHRCAVTVNGSVSYIMLLYVTWALKTLYTACLIHHLKTSFCLSNIHTFILRWTYQE